ncbi:hypothetical protein FN846DRAFT_894381 [Sphaerosporella brunnea]|uniref:Uncharacterized protein n=1 Tax=Sphaerosporella brunnea TaxID=1250544 RepID=A0A5J5EJ75_9PEZI|nr:hypothetical protein FN846DRAFT_894381 [Sphaerosporella brunnea]
METKSSTSASGWHRSARETERLIQQVIAERFGGDASLSYDGEKFLDPESAFQRLTQYAFAQGFAVVEIRRSEKEQRRTDACVHHGKPKNEHKLAGEPVRKDVFEKLNGVDDEGTRLRQRQGMSRQHECTFAVTVNRLKHRSGPLKGEHEAMWTFHQRKLNHCNHQPESNPFLYRENSAFHPGNALALEQATRHRAAKTPYRNHRRQAPPEGSAINKIGILQPWIR